METKQTRQAKLKELTVHMKKVSDRMRELETESLALSKAGRQEESYNKVRALREAQRYYRKLNAERKRLWLAERK